jgi:hypothetical protein
MYETTFYQYIQYYFFAYLNLSKEFLLENKYLCISFFVNYTFLYFLYCNYLYYIKIIPVPDTENLKNENIRLEKLVSQINTLCNNLQTENTILRDSIKQQDNDNNKIKVELGETQTKLENLKTRLYDCAEYLKNHGYNDSIQYMTEYLFSFKKRKRS